MAYRSTAWIAEFGKLYATRTQSKQPFGDRIRFVFFERITAVMFFFLIRQQQIERLQAGQVE